MKRCPECNVVYENSLDICPTCGDTLENIAETPRNSSVGQFQNSATNISTQISNQRSENDRNNPAYTFEQNSSGNIIINGAVAESNTQQYYQSRLTKFIHAVFSGEPYQLSHTSFTTLLRVEEHTTRGYPEHARDITIYGNMQNVFAVGDDVTVTARRKGNRIIARRVYNHTINDYVRIQSYIPASAVRVFAVLILIAIVFIINSISNINFSSITAGLGGGIATLLTYLLPTALVVALVWYCIRWLFKGR